MQANAPIIFFVWTLATQGFLESPLQLSFSDRLQYKHLHHIQPIRFHRKDVPPTTAVAPVNAISGP
jgi:hypothetical protein